MNRPVLTASLLLALAVLLALTACSSDSKPTAAASQTSAPDRLVGPLPSAPPAIDSQPALLADGTQLQIIADGKGPAPASGDHITIDYTTWVKDGSVVESTFTVGKGPLDLVLGDGSIIPGWEHALTSMHVGGQYRLTVPPDLAYGAAGAQNVPPNATLITDIQLVADADRTPVPTATP